PFLFVDRVIDIQGEPGSMGLGSVWTETEVKADSWYLNEGYMPFGVLIEAGQANMFLVSWLGADFENKGERVYRLLGCEATFHGSLPKPGETLTYDIHIDGFSRHGAVQLFSFHYDCKVEGQLRLSVRNGRAGFFTYEELASSRGVMWNPESAGAD